MKASTFNLHSISRKAKVISSNRQMVFLTALFFAGLMIGSFSIKSDSSYISEKIIPLYINYVRSKSVSKDVTVFFSTLLLNSSVIILSYFIGLCAVGVPFVLIIPALCGIFVGAVSGYIYQTYMLSGLGYCAIIIFPAAVISISAIIFSCKESLLMSKNMLSLLSQRHNSQYEDFKSYSMRFIIYITISAAGALTETVMTHLFIGLFRF